MEQIQDSKEPEESQERCLVEADSSAIIKVPVLVVGAGPVGLFAVFACGMKKLSCCVVDSLPMLGGQCQLLYPQKPIYDIPGFPSVTAERLVQHLAQQAQPFAPQYLLGHTAQTAMWHEEARLWSVMTHAGQCIHASILMICAGPGAFLPKKPPLDGLETIESASVRYAIQNMREFAGKHVVVAGGGDSALDWAIVLCDIAHTVHIVHRRPEFRAQPHTLAHMQNLVQQGRITLHTPFQLSGLQHAQGKLTHVVIQDFQQQERCLLADYLLPFYGMSSDLGPLTAWGLAMEKGRILIDPTTGATNLPGVYAAGDVATYPHKLQLILTGFAEVAQASHHMVHYLYPHVRHSFQHSTSQGIPTTLDTSCL